jgi:NitT/TauT family transport system substrate-binding protein
VKISRAQACTALGGFVASVRPAAGDEPQAVRAISIPTDAAKQILYAKGSGIFLKHGLRVDISPMGNGAAIFAAVAGGSAEFGSGSLFPVFNAYGHGIPLRIVAPIGIYDTDHCDTWLLVARDSTIHTPRDLNGRIMGADNTSDIYISATRAWLDLHGGDGTSLRATEIPATAQLAALNVGRIDAAVLKPPYLTVAMNSGNVRVLGKPLDLIAPRFLISCWVATVDFIAKHPDIVNAFAAALAESSRYTNAHQAETVEMVAAYSGQDPALLRRGVRSVTTQSVTLAEIQRPLDFAFTSGFIDRHYDARPLLAPSMRVL